MHAHNWLYACAIDLSMPAAHSATHHGLPLAANKICNLVGFTSKGFHRLVQHALVERGVNVDSATLRGELASS